MDLSFLDHPALKGMHNKKRDIMIQLAKDMEGKSMKQAAPYLMKANQQLRNQKLSFTKEETAIIMELLTKDMSPAEKQKVDIMVNKVNKNKAGK